MQLIDDSISRSAASYLIDVDAILKPVIEQNGLCTIRPNTNYYQELVDAIISQQLSVHAARAIEQRFLGLFQDTFPTAQQILGSDVETLRGIGLSRAKASYVLDLAQHVVDGRVRFEHLDLLTNEEVIIELTAVKGIGVWTAHMFLMFCMGRSDILPVGDLGIRNGIRQLYGFTDTPIPDQITKLATEKNWHPYETIVSWYIWRALDNTPSF
jgi:DNA-3-methyladenine glycosylase II